MAANDITISDLTFEGIRDSLIEYLKKQNTFKDYNFEGSAIRTLIDLLAYNTFYYGYYSNMMANEMFLDTAKMENSMISLTKPLGYVVYNSLSAKSTLKLTDVNPSYSSLSAFSTFKGTNPAGRPYYFYNIRSIAIKESDVINGLYETPSFEVYEGRGLIRRQLVQVDLTTQSFSLPNVEIDPRTITIEVGDANSENLSLWTNYYLSPDTIVGSNTEVFFIERTKVGYNVNFGKISFDDDGGSSNGKQITDQNTVYVSYLVSSGSNANGISNIKFVSDPVNSLIAKQTTLVEMLINSRNGTSSPDLDEIRFFAPKSFASQGRVVTKNDYYAVLNELGYGAGTSPEFGYKVFGGEEATPPVYGRVFVSIIDLNPTDESDYTQQSEINRILSTLKNKSVVSILPEYLAPFTVKIALTLSLTNKASKSPGVAGQIRTSVRNALEAEYGAKKYDRSFIEIDIKNIARNAYLGTDVPNVFMDIIISSPKVPDAQARKINLKNQISSVKITGFDDPNYYAQDNGKHIYLYQKTTLISKDPIGEVDLTNGIISIYPNVTSNELVFSVKVPDNNFTAKDEIVSYLDTTNDLKINI